jgi:hypothetical protein
MSCFSSYFCGFCLQERWREQRLAGREFIEEKEETQDHATGEVV